MSARLGVLSRVVAAGVGGFLLANGVAAACAVAVPSGLRAEAVLAGMMLGLSVQLGAALWAFAAASAGRAWAGLLLPGAAVSAVLLVLSGGSAP